MMPAAARTSQNTDTATLAASFAYIEPGPTDDPFDLAPCYQTTDGKLLDLPVASSFSVARLAAGFATGGLRREVWAVPPWSAVTRLRIMPSFPRSDFTAEEFPARFEEAVAAEIGSAGRVAVTVSGGMDSAAVLATAARVCRRSDRELVAVVLGIPDDTGGSPAVMAQALIEALGVDVPILVVNAEPGQWPEPVWCPHGPRFDAWPRYRRGIAETAGAHGAEVLLHGTGADELLTTPRHLASYLVRHKGLRAARVYLKQHDEPVVEQLVPAWAGRIGRRWQAEWYWSLTWPYLATTDPPPT